MSDVLWRRCDGSQLGPTRALIEEVVAQAIESGHVPTLVATYLKADFEIVRGDAGAARRDVKIVVDLSQENAFTLGCNLVGRFR